MESRLQYLSNMSHLDLQKSISDLQEITKKQKFRITQLEKELEYSKNFNISQTKVIQNFINQEFNNLSLNKGGLIPDDHDKSLPL